jgi:hypothetical protein
LQALGDKKLIDAAPIFALTNVYALRMSGRADEATAQAAAMVAKDPSNCEARAALAGLRLERNQQAAARQLVASAVNSARSGAVGPATIRCAALSAAAIGDAPLAASLLKRIAEDETMLRSWAQEITGTTGSKLLRRHMFPWTHVVDHPSVIEAKRALDAAYESARGKIAAVLDPVTPR